MAGNNQQINVSMRFNADTKQAQQAINSLQATLTKLSSGAGLDLGNKQMQQAVLAARDLQKHLNAALNTDTGKLNLNKLNASLASSNQNLTTLSTSLIAAGADGQKAFIQMAQSISNAEAPVFKLNGLLGKIWTSLKSVATWTISTAVLNAFTNSISTAYRFAQDLNKSLNEIRIVTGYSVEEVDKFAKKANAAAKALSATTTEYTKASLIYYQQGLSDAEIEARTAATIKMANVTGQSVEEVSNQLTAVWNNFAKGGDNLMYYADVMTALGAATASGSDEISEGLNKFAAVAETVGLSYDYAASALATVTATTRESADVVGNAFKTLFARIQGLQLGETLDDGTNLNKYSEALQKVGIDIMDASGNMKNMDTILDEMGAKWDTLSQAQQTALAQTVAGVRQYTQLVALMENWDYFQENLGVARSSSGTLDEQAKIYADGWEAARDRVTASLEDIYQDVLDDDFFIGFLDGMADLIESVDHFIENIGGIGPIFMGLGSMILGMVSNKIQPAFNNLAISIKSIFDPAASAKAMESQVNAAFDKMLADPSADFTVIQQKRIENTRQMLHLQTQFHAKSKNMSEAEKAVYELQLQLKREQQEELIKLEEQAEKERKIQEEKKQAQIELLKSVDNQIVKERELLELKKKAAAQAKVNAAQEQYNAQQQVQSGLNKYIEAVDQNQIANLSGADRGIQIKAAWLKMGELDEETRTTIEAMTPKQINQQYERYIAAAGKAAVKADELKGKLNAAQAAFNNTKTDKAESELDQMKNASLQAATALKELQIAKANNQTTSMKTFGDTGINFDNIVNNPAQQNQITQLLNLDQAAISTKGFQAVLKEATVDVDKLYQVCKILGIDGTDSFKNVEQSINNLTDDQKKIKELEEEIRKLKAQLEKPIKIEAEKKAGFGVQQFSDLAAGMGQTAFAIQSLSSAFKTLGDESIPIGQKLLTTITSLSFALPSLISGLTKITSTLGGALGLSNPTVAALLVIVGLVTTLGIGLFNIEDAATKTTKKLTEYAKETKKQFEDLNKAAQDFKNTISEWETSKKALEDLEYGTKEYSEALKEANKQAKELIETYGLYNDYDVQNGLISIDPNKIKEIQSSYDYRAQIAEMVNSDAQRRVDENQIENKMTDLADQLSNPTYSENLIIDWANAANSQNWEQVDLSETKQDSSSKALTVADIEKIGQVLAEANAAEQLVDTKGYLENYFKEGSANYNAAILDNIDNIVNQTEAIQEAYEARQSLTEAENFATLSLFRSSIQFEDLSSRLQKIAIGDDGKIKEKDAGNIVEIATQMANRAYQDNARKLEIDDILSEIPSNADWYSATGNIKFTRYQDIIKSLLGEDSKYLFSDSYSFREDIYKKYAEIMGYDYASIGSKTVDGIKHTTFLDKEGKEVGSIKDDYSFIVQTLIDSAANEARAQVMSNVKELSLEEAETLIGEATAKTQDGDYKSSLLAFLADPNKKIEAEDFSQSQIKAIQEGNLNPEQILSAMGLSEDLASSMGYNWEDLKSQVDNLDLGKLFNQEAYNAEMDEKGSKKAEELDIDVEEYEAYRDLLAETRKELKNNREELNRVALEEIRASKGIKTLSDNWENWEKILKKGTIVEQAEIAEELNGALKNLMNLTDEEIKLLPPDFAKNNADLIEQAANNMEAARQQLIEKVKGTNAGDQALKDINAENLEKDSKRYGDIVNGLAQKLNDEIASYDISDFEVGVAIDDQNFINKCNQIIQAAGFTAEQAQEYFKSMGYDAEVTIKTITTQRTIARRAGTDMEGDAIYAYEVLTETTQVPVIKTITPSGSYGGSIGTSGGGGGGSSKQETKDTVDEQGRYKVIEEELDDLSKSLDKLGKAKDRAFGKAKLNLIQQELKLLEQEAALQQDLIDEVEYYLNLDRQRIENYGAKFDANNDIYNRDEIIAAEVARYNAAMESGDEKAIEDAKKRYEEFMKYLEQYEETLDKFEEETQRQIEIAREQADKRLEGIKYTIELNIELSEDAIKLLDYFLKKIEDDAYEAAEAIALLGKKTEEIQKQIEANQTGLNDILADHGMTIDQVLNATNEELYQAGFTEQEIEEIRRLTGELLSANEDLMEIRKEIDEQFMRANEHYNERAKDHLADIEFYSEMAQSYKDIIALVGEEISGLGEDFLSGISEGIVNNSQQQLQAAKDILDINRAALAEAEKELNYAIANGDEARIEAAQKNVEAMQDVVQESEKTLVDQANETIKLLQDMFTEAIEKTVDKFEESISGMYGSLERMQEAFDQQSEISDRYVDDYERIYELSKLNRDIMKSIDETDSIAAKQALRDLQAEINALQESGEELSKHDLEYMRKRYDLRVAEIALEEAQNAKNQVRMSRDNEGNWSYVYTADQDATASARQNVEDKLYELQELEQNYIDEMSEAVIQAQVDMAEAIRNLRVEDFDSVDEFEAEKARIVEYYTGLRNYYLDELNTAIGNSKTIYEQDWKAYSDYSGYKLIDSENWIDNFDETILSQVTGYTSVEAAQSSYKTATDQMLSDLTKAYISYADEVTKAWKVIEGQATTTTLDEIGKKSDEALVKVKATGDEYTRVFTSIAQAVADWYMEYSSYIDNTITENENLAESYTQVIDKLADMAEAYDVAAKAAENLNEETKKEDTVPAKVSDDSPETPSGTTSGGINAGWDGFDEVVVVPKKSIETINKEHGWDEVGMFNTGGYTGAWGNTGRLAILHEKELVLNKADTANLLASVEMLRKLSGLIDFRAALQARAGLLGSLATGNAGQILQQEVTIHAEFPNVNSRVEIEEAFSSLINRASQFANRKN